MIKLTPEQQEIAIAYAVKVGMTQQEAEEMMAFYLERQLRNTLTNYLQCATITSPNVSQRNASSIF